jgi:hypothetical protein
MWKSEKKTKVIAWSSGIVSVTLVHLQELNVLVVQKFVLLYRPDDGEREGHRKCGF